MQARLVDVDAVAAVDPEGRVRGSGRAERRPRSWELTAIAADGMEAEILPVILRSLLDLVRDSGGGPTRWWVSGPTPTTDEAADSTGLRDRRDLYQMRRPLPVVGEWRGADPAPTRSFRPGTDDEQAWIEVNNRAFASHPDQSGYTLDRLHRRMAEPWFDPEGFLLHERDGRLVGFCWTKVHAHHDPPLGEIYAIAVDPDVAGAGLGRALTLAGLDWLADQGLEVGMLYVDASNTGAVHTYEGLGFSVHHIDRAYQTVV